MLGLAACCWPFVGLALGVLQDDDTDDGYGTVVNERNDVTADLTLDLTPMYQSRLVRRADRGWASREHVIRSVGFLEGGDSGPPPMDLAFTAADELTVSYEGRVFYQLVFDPRTLDIRAEDCNTIEVPTSWGGRYVIGCAGRPNVFWG